MDQGAAPVGITPATASAPEDAMSAEASTNEPVAAIDWSAAGGMGGSLTIGRDGRPRLEDSSPSARPDGPDTVAGPHRGFKVSITIDQQPRSPAPATCERTRELYLDLMKKCLTRLVFAESGPPIHPLFPKFVERFRREGRDWPADAETMVGITRLDNVQDCIVDVIQRQVPGDLIEAGVWRGGTTIFMRAVLEVYGDTERKVWVADSFAGLPTPDYEVYPADRLTDVWQSPQLAVALEDVKANFARYGFLDDRVQYLKGWFKDTLPVAPIDKLAVMRLDGDLYQSTMDGLVALYPKLSVGGYVILDDYNLIPPVKMAADDYRRQHGIVEPVQTIDWNGSFWQKER
ncbi:MAG: TylF/MycF/NovP-related O-methyltransferase [Thermomicrobiales bacterium]